MIKLLDTSNELVIQRHLNGIRLVDPRYAGNTGVTVSAALELPLSVYFLNKNSAAQNMNEICASACDFRSIKEAISKTVHDVLKPACAINIINNDKQVLSFKKIKIAEEISDSKNNNDHVLHGLVIKAPWYDDKNHVVGIFGVTTIMGMHPLPESLEHIMKLGLFNQSNCKQILPGLHIGEVYLTKRESDILKYTIMGKSARKTGEILSISPRTVEYHLENIKSKMRVNSKSELIEKCIFNGNNANL